MAQETFKRLVENRERIRDPGAGVGWLYQTTAIAVDRLRARAIARGTRMSMRSCPKARPFLSRRLLPHVRRRVDDQYRRGARPELFFRGEVPDSVDDWAPRVSVGAVLRLGVRPLPLLQIHLADWFSLDAYASAHFAPHFGTIEDEVLGGLTLTF